MKFDENTPVTVLQPIFGEAPRILRGWTDQGLSDGARALPLTLGEALLAKDEGLYWMRGHEADIEKALRAARALR